MDTMTRTRSDKRGDGPGEHVEWESLDTESTGPLTETWAAVLGGGWIATLVIFFTTTPAPPEGQPPPPFELIDAIGLVMLATLLATAALAARRSAHTPTLAIITAGLALLGQLACAVLNHAPVTAGWFVFQTAAITVMAGVSVGAYLNRHRIVHS